MTPCCIAQRGWPRWGGASVGPDWALCASACEPPWCLVRVVLQAFLCLIDRVPCTGVGACSASSSSRYQSAFIKLQKQGPRICQFAQGFCWCSLLQAFRSECLEL